MQIDLNSLTIADAAEMLAKRACAVRLVKKAGLFKQAAGMMDGISDFVRNNQDSLKWGLGGAALGGAAGALASGDDEDSHPWRNAVTGALAGGAGGLGLHAAMGHFGNVVNPAPGSDQRNINEALTYVNAKKNDDWNNLSWFGQFKNDPVHKLNDAIQDVPGMVRRGIEGSTVYNGLLNRQGIANAAKWINSFNPAHRPYWATDTGSFQRGVTSMLPEGQGGQGHEIAQRISSSPRAAYAYLKALQTGQADPGPSVWSRIKSRVTGGPAQSFLDRFKASPDWDPQMQTDLDRVAATRRIGDSTLRDPSTPPPLPQNPSTHQATAAALKEQLRQLYRDVNLRRLDWADVSRTGRDAFMRDLPDGVNIADRVARAAAAAPHGTSPEDVPAVKWLNVEDPFLENLVTTRYGTVEAPKPPVDITPGNINKTFRAGAEPYGEVSRMGGSGVGQLAAFALPAIIGGRFNDPDAATWAQQRASGEQYMQKYPATRDIVQQMIAAQARR